MDVEISVVVPVYGCAPCLGALHERVRLALQPLTDSWELILVDDRSPDQAWDVISALAANDAAVRGLRLSRNFGQHAAITAGLAASRGRWIVVMDCDLQEPPEVIPRLYEAAREGFDIVFARRRVKQSSFLRRWLPRIYYAMLSAFSGVRLRSDYGALSIASRKVIDSALAFRDRDRQYLLMLHWLGYTTTSIDYDHGDRHAGRSSYTLRSLLRIAADGIFFQTTRLLRWIVYFGFVIAALGALLALYYLIARFTGTGYPGFTSLAVLILTLGGFVIMTTGIVGLYVGKVFEQVKGRPLFVLDAEVGEATERSAEPRERAPA
jgi:glycosyltransferase involved in cell wall biosynthesis